MTVWEKIKYEYNKGGSAIRQIILINLGVFVFTIFVGIIAKLSGFQPNELLEYFYIPSNLGVLLIRPWSVITNIFFHSGFWHILGNMLMLYFIGRVLEDFMDSAKVWKIFLYGGLAGAALFVISYNVFPIFAEVKSYKKLLGASGGVTAILVATGFYVPRYQIRPFGLFNVEMRWVALFLVFRDLYLFPVSDNTGGLFAHIGGAIFGMLFILQLQGKIELPTINGKSIIPSRMKKIDVDESTLAQERAYKKYQPNQDQIDAILDKISQSGYDSLSTTEKDILFKASE
jgi:membrane associated rhomboid family serine protease